MEERQQIEKKCPYCGTILPGEAAFCPCCARSINQREALIPPRPPVWKKILRVGIPLLVIAGIVLGICLYNRPKVFDDGTAEVIYTDPDGTYQILIGWMDTPYTPAPYIHQIATLDAASRFPSCLFVNYLDSGINAAEAFLRKVEHVTAEFSEPADPSGYITYTEPAANDAYVPDAAMVSYVDYLGRENSAVGTWTITMKNGDVIRLHQTFEIELAKTYDYYPEDVSMDTVEDLQALVNMAGQIADTFDIINIHLPAVTYEGVLLMTERPVNLYGSADGETRTTFTDTIQVLTDESNSISNIYDVDFVGDGDGVGLSVSGRTYTVNCSFTGWKTAMLCHGTGNFGGIAFEDCCFEDNTVAVHFNTNEINIFRSFFTGNEFIHNGTGILLEGIPTTVTMNFENSLFSGNGTDIANRCNQPLDISKAIFQ